MQVLSRPPNAIDVLDKGFASLIDEPNSDKKVVNAARVSFAKKSTWDYSDVSVGYTSGDPLPGTHPGGQPKLKEADAKLIQYLAKHNHWTPFAHCRFLYSLSTAGPIFGLLEDAQTLGVRWKVSLDEIFLSGSLWTAIQLGLPVPTSCEVSYSAACKGGSPNFFVDMFPKKEQEQPHQDWTQWPEETPITLHLKMPIFVARQWMRSNVGIVYNEVSRRYVDSEPEFHTPDCWRGRPPKSLKQGSGGEVANQMGIAMGYHTTVNEAVADYNHSLGEGVAPEQARIVLPLSTYTEFWMTCSAQALARIVKLRLDPHAQWEVRQYAEAVSKIAEQHFGAPLWTQLLNPS